MTSRFYTNSIDVNQGTALLEEGEAHHLLHVMRLKMGEEVTLFDGKGNAWRGRITKTDRRRAELELLDQITVATKSSREIVLAVAPPKGDRFRWLVEKVTELGINRLIPLKTERTVVDPGAGKMDKLKQTMISACKQCGRNEFLAFESQRSWEVCLEEYHQTHHLLIAHPNGAELRDIFVKLEPSQSLLIGVGPEGGFTEEEIDQALQAQASLVSLGDSILRTETAAISLSAAVMLQ
ncbi:MAG: 16S rRNA (uracil(1498)-N(3))-methyltransferase [Planctomycetaceae bacterium]|nr:16S rRNA (uracil(1498)-N(3))-methyltransferase [Planctomycetaceae bacterium]